MDVRGTAERRFIFKLERYGHHVCGRDRLDVFDDHFQCVGDVLLRRVKHECDVHFIASGRTSRVDRSIRLHVKPEHFAFVDCRVKRHVILNRDDACDDDPNDL